MDEHYLYHLKNKPKTPFYLEGMPDGELFKLDDTYFLELCRKHGALDPLIHHKEWLEHGPWNRSFKNDTGEGGFGNHVKMDKYAISDVDEALRTKLAEHKQALEDYICYEEVEFVKKLYLLEKTQKVVQRHTDIPFGEQVKVFKEKLFKTVGLPPLEKEIDKNMLGDYYLQMFDLYLLLRSMLEYISNLYLIEIKAHLFQLYFQPNKNYISFLNNKGLNTQKQKLSTKEFMAYIDIMQEVEPKIYPKIEIGSKQFFNKYEDQLAGESNCNSHHSLRTFKAKTGNTYRKNYLHIYRSNDWNTLTKETLQKLSISIKNVRRKFNRNSHNEVINNFNKRIKEIENHIAEKEDLLYKT